MKNSTARIRDWLRQSYPQHHHVYFGLSGSTLLFEALQAQSRSTVVLPAFICPYLSTVTVRAGKKLIHIDANRHTQLPDVHTLELYLSTLEESDTILLVDHSYGYPFPAISRLRERFPQLLIVEDCARALGTQIRTEPPGKYADWILLSMYKTVLGSTNGAILLTKAEFPSRRAAKARPTFQERLATSPPLRRICHELQRWMAPPFRVDAVHSNLPQWEPIYGFPSDLCVTRFANELEHLESRALLRQSIAEELTHNLGKAGIDCVPVAEGCQRAGHFVSFHVQEEPKREQLFRRLWSQGLFVTPSWHIVPAFYRFFADTFVGGHVNSTYLAKHMVHVRMSLFQQKKKRERLVEEIRRIIFEADKCCA
jgi:dTDP-4-amino-4,6-dideoxygalactose transaminase